jgi:hypothetical protein
MALEPPRVERVSHQMVMLYRAMLTERGWTEPEALAWILRVLRACQQRN